MLRIVTFAMTLSISPKIVQALEQGSSELGDTGLRVNDRQQIQSVLIAACGTRERSKQHRSREGDEVIQLDATMTAYFGEACSRSRWMRPTAQNLPARSWLTLRAM